MLPRRLRRLPSHTRPGGLVVHEARGFRARLLGLAFLRGLPPDHALLIPRCRSVHTFGMRFALELTWVDARGRIVRVDDGVPPRNLRRCATATSVIERAAVTPTAAAGSPPAPRPQPDP